MCLGIPGKIIEITDPVEMLGHVEVSGIKREVNLACVVEDLPENLINHWVLVHVGFAMCVIDEAQAKETLEALEAMSALDHELDDFSQRQQSENG
ncbi:HypC/HybG/HupF family hydrogenase formation chaperone [Vibrio sp. RC27]